MTDRTATTAAASTTPGGLQSAVRAARLDPIVLSAEAVQAKNARWLVHRPWSFEYDAVRAGDASWLAESVDRPRDLSAAHVEPCPRCGGTGVVKFSRPGGPVREICSICDGRGSLDPQTAETVRKLIEAEDVGDGVGFPPDPDDRSRAACCPEEADAPPCLSCALGDAARADHPAEMADTFRSEYHRAVARTMAGLPFRPEPAADDDRYMDEGPTLYPADDMPYIPTEEDLSWYNALSREREERLWTTRIEAGPSLVEKLRAEASRLLDDIDDDLQGLGEHLWELAEEVQTLEAKSWGQYRDRLDAVIDSMAPEARRVPWATTAMTMNW